MKCTIWFMFLMVCVFSAKAQESVLISGYVTDEETGERLSGAHIRMGSNHTVTNNYGFYSIFIPAANTPVFVSYVGYPAFDETLSLRKDTVLSISLKPGVDLGDVVVTSNQMRNVEEKGLGNMRVNLSQLSVSPLFLGERDIVKTMQFLPGVSSGMEGSSNLNIRGGANDQTLYLMDDVPVYNQNHTFGLVSIFNPDALLSADIYKGGIPSIYGNRMSGVASIAVKDGNMKSHHQRISIGLLSGALSAEGPVIKDKLCYLFTARRSFLDLFVKGYMAIASENDASGALISFWDINGKMTWKMSDKTRLSLSVYNGRDDLGAKNIDRSSYSNEKTVERLGLGWTTTTASMRLTSNIRPNSFLSSSVYYSYLNNFDYFNIETNDIKLQQRKMSRLQEVGWRSSIEKKLLDNHTLFVGFDASLQYYNPDYMIKKSIDATHKIKNGNKSLLSSSVFAYDEVKYGRWTFVPGLRASFYNTKEKNKLAIEPRAKVSVFADNNNKFMLAYDRMTQPVHSVNEMNYTVQTDFWLPFNEDLLPASNQVSVGWKNYSVRNTTFSIEAYYKRMNNIIMIRDLENYMDFHTDYHNGTGRSMGIELMSQYSKGRFNSWLSYTLSKSERTFDGRTSPFKYDAPHDVSLFASYVVYKKGPIKNTLSMNMQYRSGLPYYVAEMSYPSMSQIGIIPSYTWYEPEINYVPEYPNTRIKDFFRTDLNFTMEKMMKKGSRSWQFSLLNATGHE
ncbi:MAG: TonB-dependent receptor, partial [Tannerella sp.]|nr:TonB-dependent receptor [Tannerella sp.]